MILFPWIQENMLSLYPSIRPLSVFIRGKCIHKPAIYRTSKMKTRLFSLLVFVLSIHSGMAQTTTDNQVSIQNLNKAMSILDNTMSKYYNTSTQCLSMNYDFSTNQPNGLVSVWEYTSAIEAVNSVMEGLVALKDQAPDLYNANFTRYQNLLANIIDGLDYYAGNLQLTSYTGTNRWIGVHGVHRANVKGTAAVSGIENVYDDQMWIIRELIRAFKLTNNPQYLARAEKLTDYVLDGWDCNLDANGNEYGGITWGPGYTSKHACSNSPLISSLVWLSELYAGKADTKTYYVLDQSGRRVQKTQARETYYLDFAKKIYDWQLRVLYDGTKGACWDAVWATSGTITYRVADGVSYRVHLDNNNVGGTFFTYNIGTMISGAADLYRVTNDAAYLSKLDEMCERSFRYFAPATSFNGKYYYMFPVDGVKYADNRGGSPWFNDVLLRGYIDAAPLTSKAIRGTAAAQTNLDYGYANNLKGGIPSVDLFNGWQTQTSMNVMYALSRASDYGMLVQSALTTGINKVAVKKKTLNQKPSTI